MESRRFRPPMCAQRLQEPSLQASGKSGVLEFPIWQFDSATNAVLAIVVFFLIRSWLRHAEVGLPVPDARIDCTLGVLYFFRRLLTSYAIFCNGVVAIQLARKLPMPEIGSKLFPWL